MACSPRSGWIGLFATSSLRTELESFLPHTARTTTFLLTTPIGKIVNLFPIRRRVGSSHQWGFPTLPLSGYSIFHTPSQERKKLLYLFLQPSSSKANYPIPSKNGSIQIDWSFGI